MSKNPENAQGDIIGLAVELIGVAILLWLFIFVIFPALLNLKG
jgi:hypothetical protein